LHLNLAPKKLLLNAILSFFCSDQYRFKSRKAFIPWNRLCLLQSLLREGEFEKPAGRLENWRITRQRQNQLFCRANGPYKKGEELNPNGSEKWLNLTEELRVRAQNLPWPEEE
jgi:hypothetical protein